MGAPAKLNRSHVNVKCKKRKNLKGIVEPYCCCCSVANLCPTLCNSMDYSPSGLPVHHQLSGLAQTQCPSSGWCHPTISSSVVPFASRLPPFPALGSFPLSRLFASGDQRIGISATTSVLPVSIQGWLPLGWTAWTSLPSKSLLQHHRFFSIPNSWEMCANK